MAFLEWTDLYQIGVDQVDCQHRQLFSLLNSLYDGMRKGAGKPALEQALHEVIAYTHTHFCTEEALMKATYCWEYPRHKEAHDEFLFIVDRFQKKYKSGAALLSSSVMEFLQQWLVTHIQKTDRKHLAGLAGPRCAQVVMRPELTLDQRRN